MNSILEAKGIKKGYQTGGEFLEVLKGVDLSLVRGESVAILGPSGAGKSTLLHILGGLDRPDEGKVYLEGCDLTTAGDGNLARIRNEKIGFVFQFHHLLPDFTVVENIALPLLIRGRPKKEAFSLAQKLAIQLGLGARLAHKPENLSAGERQRVAVARAVITEPVIILADEPTGNLDYDNSIMILELLKKINRQRMVGLIIVSHNPLIQEYTDRRFALKGGYLSAL
ncbi:lipoprotein-releasing system ATP-binding protein LolD [candidate division WOR-3 bacterium]|uniref:Lipoprotein-releasing system ATP-binding protein LolD n=1 Tax=candidate division WOR-3 bacterium TaxID=2052148 RepID=A0A660SG79_UNCW3|nr:MAG: lipoprotein-releasing system ATP-binding protein LolD [candidate division WOR-3 bacterium]